MDDAPDRALGRRSALTLGLVAGAGLLASAGSAAALVQAEVVPGRDTMWDTVDPYIPDRSPHRARGPVEWLTWRSQFRPGIDTRALVMTPPGTDLGHPAGLPVCLVLHGRGARAHDAFLIRLPGFLADAVAEGTPPFALVAVDGGSTYWHPRTDGSDTMRLLVEDVLPRLAARGYATGPADRTAVLGWSMGGYGALLMAQTLPPTRLAAAVASSPSLWTRYRAVPPGIFDSQQDFDRHDVFRGRHRMRGVAVRVDCALGDQYLAAVRAFVTGSDPRPAGGFWPGGHNRRFWRRMAPAQLRFVGAALAR